MLEAAILGLGVVAPGVDDWPAMRALLRGEMPWPDAPLNIPKPALLPANERRRTTTLIRMAIGVAEQAQQQSGLSASELACVFASSEGDTAIVDRLCEALSQPAKPVSPTQFHNSVHNAPAGYWAIAAQARGFSTSITAGPGSLAAGLLEGLSWLHAEQMPVLLLAYDVALPASLAPHGDVQQPFAMAMVLAPDSHPAALARLRLSSAQAAPSPTLPVEAEALHEANPAAAALPLLWRLARGESGGLCLPTSTGELALELQAC